MTLGFLVYPEPEFLILTVSIDPTDVTIASRVPGVVPSPSIVIVGGISSLYPEPV